MLPGIGWAEPITWEFSWKLNYVRLGEFDPGLRLGTIVYDEVVWTPLSGSLHFDPAEAVFRYASDRFGVDRPGATECLPSDTYCGYHLDVRFEIEAGTHELDGAWRAVVGTWRGLVDARERVRR